MLSSSGYINEPSKGSGKVKFAYYAITAFLFFMVGFSVATCNRPSPQISVVTVTEHTSDTVEIIDTFLIVDRLPAKVVVDSFYVYDTIEHGNKYYNLSFVKDSVYKIDTYGGFVDSIKAEVYQKEITIKDTFKITTTIKETVLKSNTGLYLDLGLGYKLSNEFVPEVGLSYNFHKIRVGVGAGYLLGGDFKNGLIIKGGVGFKLNK